MNQYFISLIRTWVPIVVGWAITKLLVIGVVVDGDVSDNLKVNLTMLVIGLYYAVARWLEQKFPNVGILLGYIKQPVYVDPKATVSQQQVAVDAAVVGVAKTP